MFLFFLIVWCLITTELGFHPCWWRVFISAAYPVQFLPLGKDGVTISSFSSIQGVRTSPTIYKKKPPYRFEMN